MSVTLMLEWGDWVLRPEGVFEVVEGYRKGVQDLGESLQNNYDPEDPSWFNGSTLYLLDENPMLLTEPGIGAEMMIRQSVEDATLRLMDLQNEDSYIDDDEHIIEIRSLIVRAVGNASYFFALHCITDTDEEITQRFKLHLLPKLPEGLSEDLSRGTELDRNITKTFM